MKSKRKIYDYNPGIQSKNVVSYAEQLLAQKSAAQLFADLRAVAEAETNRVRYQEERRLQLVANKFREQQRRASIEGVESFRKYAKTEAKKAHLKNIKKMTRDSRGISNQLKPEDLACGLDGCKTVAARLSITLDNSERSYQRRLFLIDEKHDILIRSIMTENRR